MTGCGGETGEQAHGQQAAAHRSVMLGALVGLEVGARTIVVATACAQQTHRGEHTHCSAPGWRDVHEAGSGVGSGQKLLAPPRAEPPPSAGHRARRLARRVAACAERAMARRRASIA